MPAARAAYEPGEPGHVIITTPPAGPSSDGWPDANYCCYGNPDAPVGNLYLSREVPEIYVMAGGAAEHQRLGIGPLRPAWCPTTG